MSSKYPTYNLTINGRKRKVKIHRMVAETFLPTIKGKDIVNHKDGDTHNFKLYNLEWCDYKENN
jgi:coenzyme F420-reducing hydrogenase beta subunit